MTTSRGSGACGYNVLRTRSCPEGFVALRPGATGLQRPWTKKKAKSPGLFAGQGNRLWIFVLFFRRLPTDNVPWLRSLWLQCPTDAVMPEGLCGASPRSHGTLSVGKSTGENFR